MSTRFIRSAAILITSVAGISASCFAGGPLGRAFETKTRALSETHRQASFSEAFLPNSPLPAWHGDYLASKVLEIERADAPNVTLYDSTGKRVTEAHFWFPDATRVILAEARAIPGGGVLASGHADRADGTTATFIAQTGPDGRMTKAIRTNPFMPEFVCPAVDGTVWALGHEVGKEEVHGEYTMLRQYDFSRGLVRALLPRKDFQKPMGFKHPETFVGCTANSLVIYSGANHKLIRVATREGGDIAPETWDVDASVISGWEFTGFAATNSGGVYASLKRSAARDADGVAHELDTGLYELVAEDPSKGLLKWSPVNGTAGSFQGHDPGREGVYILYGTDGENLVFSTTNEFRTLFWAAPIVN